MTGLQEYHVFVSDLESELERIQTILARQDASGTPCAPGCSACCRPFTVFPLEAFAVMASSELSGLGEECAAPGTCPFLTRGHACSIYSVRPYLCRTRGYPVLHLNEDGELERDSCARRSFPRLGDGAPGLRLEAWNARLFRLNEEFCDENRISPRRVSLVDLRAAANASHDTERPLYPATAAPLR